MELLWVGLSRMDGHRPWDGSTDGFDRRNTRRETAGGGSEGAGAGEAEYLPSRVQIVTITSASLALACIASHHLTHPTARSNIARLPGGEGGGRTWRGNADSIGRIRFATKMGGNPGP